MCIWNDGRVQDPVLKREVHLGESFMTYKLFFLMGFDLGLLMKGPDGFLVTAMLYLR